MDKKLEELSNALTEAEKRAEAASWEKCISEETKGLIVGARWHINQAKKYCDELKELVKEKKASERFDLRMKLAQILGVPLDEDLKNAFEKAFDWIMEGKKVDQGGKLFCLKYARKHCYCDYTKILYDAKKIFNILL